MVGTTVGSWRFEVVRSCGGRLVRWNNSGLMVQWLVKYCLIIVGFSPSKEKKWNMCTSVQKQHNHLLHQKLQSEFRSQYDLYQLRKEMKQPVWLDLGSGCPYRGSKHSSKRMQKVGIKQSHHFCGVSLQVVASALVSSIFVGVFLRAPWIRDSQWMPLHLTLINSLDRASGTLLEISKLEDAHVALAEGELGRRVRCLEDFVCFFVGPCSPSTDMFMAAQSRGYFSPSNPPRSYFDSNPIIATCLQGTNPCKQCQQVLSRLAFACGRNEATINAGT